MKKLILLLLFIPLVSFGQKSNDADALKLCVALQSNNFTTDAEAEDAVNKILSVIGASQKPILQACSNINNAVAAVYKGQRYILYDRDFMNSLTAGSNQYWSNMFILAHEVGHHINGHSLDIVLYASDIIDPKSLEERRKQELEADEFAGFVMAKLGATLKQTSLVMRDIPSISNENDSTHPSKEKRISSVRVGFKKGGSNTTLKKKNNISEKESIVYKGPAKLQNAKDYLNRGIYNQEMFENYLAMSDYTNAIKIEPDFTEVYLKRASLKQELEDLNGALDDYNKAIESKFVWYLFWIDYVDVTTYYKRGVVKNLLKDHKGAIEDFNKAIDIDPNYILAYLERGNTKFKLAQLFSSIHDIITEIKPSWFNRDSELTDEEFWSIQETIAAEISQASDAERSDIKVLKTVLRETYKGAIEDWNRVIDIDPSFTEIYIKKGRAKMWRDNFEDLKDYYGAIEDFTKAIDLSTNKLHSYFYRAAVFILLKDYKSADMDYSKIISIAPNMRASYWMGHFSNPKINHYRKMSWSELDSGYYQELYYETGELQSFEIGNSGSHISKKHKSYPDIDFSL